MADIISLEERREKLNDEVEHQFFCDCGSNTFILVRIEGCGVKRCCGCQSESPLTEGFTIEN